MTDRPIAIVIAIYLGLGACAYIRDEVPVRRLSDAEVARLPELMEEARRRNSAELEARAEARAEAAARDQRTFEQTVAAIPAADAALSQGETTRSDSEAAERPECHLLVARAARREADDRTAGRKADSSETVAGRKAAMACLAKHPEGVEGRDADGARPLHIAAMFGGTRMVAALRKKGANMTATDNAGNYPADYAESSGFSELAAVLAQDGRTDWRLGKFPPHRAQVTDAGSVFVRTWIGEVFRICTTDGKPPRDDKQNVLFGLKVTWGSEGKCRSETLFYAPNQVKDASAISLSMRPCFPDFPTREESMGEECKLSAPF